MTTKKTTTIEDDKLILRENSERMFLNGYDSSDTSYIKYDVSEVRSSGCYFSASLSLSDGCTSTPFDVGIYSDGGDKEKEQYEYEEAFEKLELLKSTVNAFVDEATEALKAFAIVRKLQ